MTARTASEHLVLVANAADSSLSTLLLSGQELHPLHEHGGLEGTGTFALAPDTAQGSSRTRLWAAVKEGAPDGGPAVVALDVSLESGSLGGLTEVARSGVASSMTYLTTSTDGRHLLGASYGGGVALVWPVHEDGRLGEPTGRAEFANLHCVVVAGGHVYLVSLGDDLVAQYRLTDEGALEPLDPPTVTAPAGSGPRHLVVHPDGRSAYVMTEFSAEALRFDRDPTSGVLTPAESLPAHDTSQGLGHSRIGIDPVEHHVVWGADLHLTDDARHLLCSERTCSTLTTIRLDERGHLAEVVSTTPTEQQPRGFAVVDDLVVAVGEKSSHVALSRVEPNGELTPLQRVPGGRGANWVRAIALR